MRSRWLCPGTVDVVLTDHCFAFHVVREIDAELRCSVGVLC